MEIVSEPVIKSGEEAKSYLTRLKQILEYLDKNKDLPEYFKKYPVYYAGPAKKPEGLPSGSFGPTTAGRMDSYVPKFQKFGGSMVMLAKGNRSQIVVDSCKEFGILSRFNWRSCCQRCSKLN